MKTLKSKWLGFTLIEVMVALAVVAVALSSLSQVSANFLFNQMTLEQRIYANWVAESEIIKLQSGLQKKIRPIATEEMMGHTWTLISKTEETDIKGIFKLTLSVYPEGIDKTSAINLVTVWSEKL